MISGAAIREWALHQINGEHFGGALASDILGAAGRRLGQNWVAHYRVSPVLVETFVDPTRFDATCYGAANCRPVGELARPSAQAQFPLPAASTYRFFPNPTITTSDARYHPIRCFHRPVCRLILEFLRLVFDSRLQV